MDWSSSGRLGVKDSVKDSSTMNRGVGSIRTLDESGFM